MKICFGLVSVRKQKKKKKSKRNGEKKEKKIVFNFWFCFPCLRMLFLFLHTASKFLLLQNVKQIKIMEKFLRGMG